MNKNFVYSNNNVLLVIQAPVDNNYIDSEADNSALEHVNFLSSFIDIKGAFCKAHLSYDIDLSTILTYKNLVEIIDWYYSNKDKEYDYILFKDDCRHEIIFRKKPEYKYDDHNVRFKTFTIDIEIYYKISLWLNIQKSDMENLIGFFDYILTKYYEDKDIIYPKFD